MGHLQLTVELEITNLYTSLFGGRCSWLRHVVDLIRDDSALSSAVRPHRRYYCDPSLLGDFTFRVFQHFPFEVVRISSLEAQPERNIAIRVDLKRI